MTERGHIFLGHTLFRKISFIFLCCQTFTQPSQLFKYRNFPQICATWISVTNLLRWFDNYYVQKFCSKKCDMNKCDPFYCEGLTRGHTFWCHTFWGRRGIWQGSGWCGWGGGSVSGCVQGGGEGLDVFDKGSHFLVSHYLGWGVGVGVGVVWMSGVVGLVWEVWAKG